MRDKFRVFFLICLSALLLFDSSAAAIAQADEEVSKRAEEARDEYLEAKEKYRQAREKYLEARTKIISWRNLSEEQKGKRLEWSKDFVGRAIEITIRHLEQWQQRVEKMTNVDQTRKSQALEEVKTEIAWLEGKKVALEQVATVEEVRAIGNEVDQYWQSKRWLVKRFVGLILSSHLQRIITRAESAITKLESAVNTAEQAGRIIPGAKDLLANLEEKTNLANDRLAKAEEKFNAISNVEEAENLFKEGHQFLKEAYGYLKEFWRTARALWEEIKG